MVAKILVTVLSLGAFSAPANAATSRVSPDELKSTFGNGKPFTAVSTSGKSYRLTLDVDGSAQEVPNGKQSGKKGKWRLSATGYCSKWGSHTEKCYTVEHDGKQFVVRDSDGNRMSTWTR